MKYLDFIKNDIVRYILKYIILLLFVSILICIFARLVFDNFIVASVVKDMLSSMEVL